MRNSYFIIAFVYFFLSIRLNCVCIVVLDEFKPASIDKTKPGSLKKTKENRVTVEFQNNQFGKPNVAFVGSSEDYKENDAVLFFDGETFRLERLHRAVKQLRHLRQPGESAAAVATTATATTAGVAATSTTASVLHSLTPPEPRLSPPVAKVAKPMHMGRGSFPTMPVRVLYELFPYCINLYEIEQAFKVLVFTC